MEHNVGTFEVNIENMLLTRWTEYATLNSYLSARCTKYATLHSYFMVLGVIYVYFLVYIYGHIFSEPKGVNSFSLPKLCHPGNYHASLC